MTDYVELANTRNDGTDGQAHHVHMRPIALASNAVAWTRNSQDLWISVSHAAWCPLPSAPTPVPDQSFLDFRSSSDWTQTIQLACGQTMSRSCSAPGSVETCWSVRRGAGRYRQDFLGRIIGLDNGVGITCTRTRVRRLVQG